MKQRFEERVALVRGGASGIGAFGETPDLDPDAWHEVISGAVALLHEASLPPAARGRH